MSRPPDDRDRDRDRDPGRTPGTDPTTASKPTEGPTMPDQANELRQLMRVDARVPKAPASNPSPSRRARSLLITSGKGGVGTSNLSLNLAVALGAMGRRVVLIDADAGLANLDLLCGLALDRDLGDALLAGKPLAETIVDGPESIRFLSGVHAARAGDGEVEAARDRLAAELPDIARQTEADFILIDGGSGLAPSGSSLADAVDAVVVVASPEPTALADAQAVVARLRRRPGGGPPIRSVIGQARSSAEAIEALDRLSSACRSFLGAAVRPIGPGFIRFDPKVPLAVRRRRPFLLDAPGCEASRCVKRLARALTAEADTAAGTAPRKGGWLEALVGR
ncbi:P-loop NTPase [Tautonia sociabilis]|uniref:MinD/ParA family protein n=1 Tax=Tautonia sociabilis TaxID=2080755 RepID=A0A432MDM8_9BACT|nr:P-loop NTPase [Tautonia sociabilis]RUL82939.1 MinD/ParA family protein [Tautonia sociabilis]